MEYENNFTSKKLRDKATSLILSSGRPLAAHEIENYIRRNEIELWSEIKKKCSDYVRIILSFSKNQIFMKYKPNYNMRGFDKRTIFYGVKGQNYSSNYWSILSENKYNEILYVTKEEYVTIEEIEKSWNILNENISTSDNFWKDLINGLRIISNEYENGKEMKNIINEIFQKFPSLQKESYREYILKIFWREVELNKNSKKNMEYKYI